jgi:hypothetical protein
MSSSSVVEWSASSLRQQHEHRQVQFELEARQHEHLVEVPTLPHQVRDALRELGLPVRLFGENPANVRDRLKRELALRQVQERQRRNDDAAAKGGRLKTEPVEASKVEEEEAMIKYTRASTELVEARQSILLFSLDCARRRLNRERSWRAQQQQQQIQQQATQESSAVGGGKNREGVSSRENKRRLSGGEPAMKEDASRVDGGSLETSAVILPFSVDSLDRQAARTFRHLRNLALEGSQYCDHRAVSSLRVVPLFSAFSSSSSSSNSSLVVAGTWTASLHVLDQQLQVRATRSSCHEDRIMSLDAMMTGIPTPHNPSLVWKVVVATASLDGTAKLFRIQPDDGKDTTTYDSDPTDRAPTKGDNEGSDKKVSRPSVVIGDTDEDVPMEDDSVPPSATMHEPSIESLEGRGEGEGHKGLCVSELAHLQGHAARLCRVAFHPMKRHVATTSFDHTWRLWDVEASQLLLLQDGHARECYGIGFHPDGSLAASTDLGGIVHLWDLRTSKSVAWYRSHAGKVLNAEFHPANGFHLATAGEDGCIHVFDLRRRPRSLSSSSFATAATTTIKAPPHATTSPLVSIPAHSGIVTSLRFDPTGECLCSSSFDGTAKVWNARSWKLLRRLEGHLGKVTSADMMTTMTVHHLPSEDGSRRDRDGATGGSSRSSHSFLRPGVVTAGFDRTVKLWN